MAPTFTTNLGLIKPDPNDVIDVSQINSNMDTLDTVIGTAQVLPAVPLSTALLTAYPLGTSMIRLQSADIAADSGWALDPGVTAAVLITFKPASDRGFQIWQRNITTDNVQSVYFRTLTNAGFSKWRKMGGVDEIEASATSTTTLLSGAWTKCLVSGTGFQTTIQDGSDLTVSGGGIKCAGGGVYRFEGFWQFDGAANAGPRLIGMDTDGAGPTQMQRSTCTAVGGEAVAGTMTMTRTFQPNDIVFLWANQANIASATISVKRIYAQKIRNV